MRACLSSVPNLDLNPNRLSRKRLGVRLGLGKHRSLRQNIFDNFGRLHPRQALVQTLVLES